MTSPRLTVKSIADILSNPKRSPASTLRDQKYPTAQPQKFRTPYYQTVVTAIRHYYEANNDSSKLVSARNRALSFRDETRRRNSIRVLDSFEKSRHAKRKFTVIANGRLSATIGGVRVSLSADMQAKERGDLRVLYFHCRGAALDKETAELICNVAHWVFDQNGAKLCTDQIEVMDLSNGTSFTAEEWRPSIARRLANQAGIITSLWESTGP